MGGGNLALRSTAHTRGARNPDLGWLAIAYPTPQPSQPEVRAEAASDRCGSDCRIPRRHEVRTGNAQASPDACVLLLICAWVSSLHRQT
ncbi:hypothetical protein CMUS01_03909 [Colletotrichum musicola]|uniref:Uncharacterized protein n=1 Tax=Colletotrichum musicola TaxID=2175873 RepID=A0A8H6NQ61_9PEZI|nr:hypothetical protein CMUS01_03909 [Colletotrichum musicola]